MTIGWCSDPNEAERLAAFFVEQVDPAYISHGEVQLGRAIDFGHWSPKLAEMLTTEIREGASARRVVVAYEGINVVALAIVSFHEGLRKYAILEDLVVDRALRRAGVGAQMLNWIERAAVEAGCRSLFLESGLQNHAAHSFFERHGFSTCSLVKVKSLGG